MDYAKESLRLHEEWKGKIEVVATVPVATKDDLSLAYTPGVAQPCLEIQKDLQKSYELTRRHNMCAVITDGTAVLGLGDIGALSYPGMGQWQQQYFRVLYAPSCDELHTHHIVNEDGTPATLPAEAITFTACDEHTDGIRMLGFPYIEEVREAMPAMLSLLQVDEDDRWNLTFHDCGTLNFMIHPRHLKERRWEKTACYLYSF